MTKRAVRSVGLPPGAYYALTVLTLLNVINLWHRYLIYNLAAVSVEDCDEVCGPDLVPFEPLCYMEEETQEDELQCLACRRAFDTGFYNLKDGACVNKAQYGVLAGVGFTLVFGLATLVAGRLTDALDRRFLHTGAILVWSLATSAHGTCKNFNCVLMTRILIGMGQAFNAPACYGLITLYFPDSHRATANGIYSTGTYLGSAVSSLCLTLAGSIGWRLTAFFSGACGVACAAVLFFTVEHNPVPVSDSLLPELEYDQIPNDETPKMISSSTKNSLKVVQVAAPFLSDAKKNLPRSMSLLSGSSEGSTEENPFATDDAATGFDRNDHSASGVTDNLLDHHLDRNDYPASPGDCYPARGAVAAVMMNGSSYLSGDGGSGGGGGLGNGITTTTSMGVVDPVLLPSSSSSPAHYYQQGYGTQEQKEEEEEENRPLLPVKSNFDETTDVAPHHSSDDMEDIESRSTNCSWYPTSSRRRRHAAARGRTKGEYASSDDPDAGFSYDAHLHRAAANADSRSKHDFGYTLRTISNSRIVLVLFAASSARMVGTWSMAGYMATYYSWAFPAETSLYSVLNAIFVSTGGMASSYLGGAISTKLRVRNEGVLGYIPALGCLGAIIPMTIVLFAKTFSVSVTALFFTYFIGECWLGPGMAVLQMELPTEMAGTSVAILLFLNAVVCNVGPWYIAQYYDRTDDVRTPYYTMVLLSFVVASILFTVVGYMISRKDKHRRRAVSALESARIYEHGHNNKDSVADTRQSSDRSRSVNYRSLGGNRRSRSPSPIGTAAHLVANGYSRNGFGGGSGRANRSPSTSMCEMVRRTFSGVGLTPSDDGYDSNYSDDTARLIEGADRLPHRVRFSGEGTGGAATGGERETLLMDGWRSGMRRKGTL